MAQSEIKVSPLRAFAPHERLIFKEDKEMDLVKALSSQYMKEELPEVQVGDTVRVHVRIKEGSRERIQVFEGTVIAARVAALVSLSPCVASPTALAVKRCSPCMLPMVQ